MSLLSIPDIVGMLVLMGVLVRLRPKHEDDNFNVWLLGLFFILIEAVAVAVYRGSAAFHSVTHAIALDAYVLAALTFGWAARQDLLPGRSQAPFFLLPAIPMFVVATLYGWGVTSTMPYLVVIIATLVLGVGYALFFHSWRPARFRAILLGIHCAMWTPMMWMAWNGTRPGALRWMTYWGLACLYLLTAFTFRGRIRRGQVGGWVIVLGFTIWALCFLLHPLTWGHVSLNAVFDRVWSMQKFLVILGMLLTLLEDETERRRSEAMHDALTGLPNRRLLNDRLEQALERCLRSGKSTALFIVDLDGFKAINDTLGHSVGDRVLRSTAVHLQSKVRSSDTLARCGGDEFCVIVNDLARRSDCERIAASLQAAVAAVSTPGGAKALSGSVGYAMFPDDAADAGELYEKADRRMYQHKRGEIALPSRLADQMLNRNSTERRTAVERRTA